jgi:D-glycero-D-manno-heptose 1,7-bisphosphate phosphatase
MMTGMTVSAVFWDRDGTLIEDPGYLTDPDQVMLLPGAAEALRRLTEAGFENVVTTNQSGIARGMLDEETLEQIHDRLRERLAAEGASVDAIYYCPFLNGDEAVVEAYRQDSDLRKPAPGMLVKASLERNIDLAGSWSIGDSLRDAQAGRAAGCRTILLRTNKDAKRVKASNPNVDFTARSVEEAVEIVLKHTRSADALTSPQGASAPPADPQSESVLLLREILAFLRTVDRRSQAEDFSLARLIGAVVQILALGMLIWAVFAIMGNDDPSVQLIRLTLAVLLQLMALTCFIIPGKK